MFIPAGRQKKIERGIVQALVPQFPHLSVAAVLGALIFFDALFFAAGLRQFRKKSRSLDRNSGIASASQDYSCFATRPGDGPAARAAP